MRRFKQGQLIANANSAKAEVPLSRLPDYGKYRTTGTRPYGGQMIPERTWIYCVVSLLLGGCSSSRQFHASSPAISFQASEPEKPRPPWESYNQQLCDAIGTAWLRLLESYDGGFVESVTLAATFRPDGTVTDLRFAATNQSSLLARLCAAAVTSTAPYHSWPVEMRKIYGDSRRVRFTFEFAASGKAYFGISDVLLGTEEFASAAEQGGYVYFPGERRFVPRGERPWAPNPTAVGHSHEQKPSFIGSDPGWCWPLYPISDLLWYPGRDPRWYPGIPGSPQVGPRP